jgi:hypothetical protein
VLLDNASTYEPLLEFYRETPHPVIWMRSNGGARSLWSGARSGQIHDNYHLTDSWFVYTDPDCVPIDECPTDAVAHLHELLERYPDAPKAGLGLYLKDAPLAPLEHERRLLAPNPPHWQGPLDPQPFLVKTYDSWVDTTLALYRPGAEFTINALRAGWPYQCRHLSPSWYPDMTGPSADPDIVAEHAYYLEHAKPGPLFSGWKAKHG